MVVIQWSPKISSSLGRRCKQGCVVSKCYEASITLCLINLARYVDCLTIVTDLVLLATVDRVTEIR